MITLPSQIDEAVKSHQRWLITDGAEGEKIYTAPRTNLSGHLFSDCDLRFADLATCDISGAYFKRANLEGVDFRASNLKGARFDDANLKDADLRETDLTGARLDGADMTGARLKDANLHDANLSGVKGLLTARDFMQKNFARDSKGWIVYKAFGNTTYNAPRYWNVVKGAFIEEMVNPDRTEPCACGVNFATPFWIANNYESQLESRSATLWKCRIRFEDSPDIVVPFGTDGKARCGRLELLNPVASWRKTVEKDVQRD